MYVYRVPAPGCTGGAALLGAVSIHTHVAERRCRCAKVAVGPSAMGGPNVTGRGPGPGSCAHGSAAALRGSWFVPTQDWHWAIAQQGTWSQELEMEEKGRGRWMGRECTGERHCSSEH